MLCCCIYCVVVVSLSRTKTKKKRWFKEVPRVFFFHVSSSRCRRSKSGGGGSGASLMFSSLERPGFKCCGVSSLLHSSSQPWCWSCSLSLDMMAKKRMNNENTLPTSSAIHQLRHAPPWTTPSTQTTPSTEKIQKSVLHFIIITSFLNFTGIKIWHARFRKV